MGLRDVIQFHRFNIYAMGRTNVWNHGIICRTNLNVRLYCNNDAKKKKGKLYGPETEPCGTPYYNTVSLDSNTVFFNG